MINRKIILFLSISSIILAQNYNDARMVGLNGSYTTLAKGYQCIGVNPANLGAYKAKSINILDFMFGINNNVFSISNYNAINGANLEDSLSYSYYPKSQFYKLFGGEGIRLIQSFQLKPTVINLSTSNFAITSSFNTNIDVGLPNGFIDLLLNGNPFGGSINFDMKQESIVSQNIGISFGHSFKNVSFGFTVKYILGLFYMGMESIDKPYIRTDITGFSGKNKYLISQAIGGAGTGIDLGINIKKSDSGFRFGASVINLIGDIKWSKDNFIRTELDNTLINAGGDYYLRPNEFIFMNFAMDSVMFQSFSQKTDKPLIFFESYKVTPVDDLIGITLSGQESNLLVEREDGGYYIPSGGEYKLNDLIGEQDTTFTLTDNYLKYITDSDNSFITREPMYLRLGMSKEWEGEAVLVFDLVTGFSDNYSSSSDWRASIASEIIRFKGRFLRIGYSFGGIYDKSVSFGYGRKIGKLYCDLGISLNGGYSIESMKGIDLSYSLFWQIDKLYKK